MNPDLVCKLIVARQDQEKKVRGTGYPIAADRIITAAHVVRDLANVNEPIEFVFGEKQETVTGAIDVVWNGQEKDPPVDVVVIKCRLPDHLQPTDLTLLRTRSRKPVAWQAQGYSAIAKTRMAGGLHDYGGPRFPKVTAKSASKELNCTSGPQRDSGQQEAQLWGGVSGSGVFEADELQRLLAVVIAYVPGETLPTLRVVPLPSLFAIDGFADAIQFDHTRHTRLGHLKTVRLALIKELQALGEAIAAVTTELEKLVDSDLDDPRPETVADAILECTDIPALLGLLRQLSQHTLSDHAGELARIAQRVLPLNYVSDTVDALHQVTGSDKRLWLVEGRATTATLAEIILAGFDGAPAKFPEGHVTGDKAELRSPVGFDYSDDQPPVEGPDPSFQNVYNELRQLLNLISSGAGVDEFDEARKRQLRAELDVRKDELGDRTTYCIVRLPGDSRERAARCNVLEDVSNAVNPPTGPPRLVFVEKVDVLHESEGDDADEDFIVQASFRQLLLRAHGTDPT